MGNYNSRNHIRRHKARHGYFRSHLWHSLLPQVPSSEQGREREETIEADEASWGRRRLQLREDILRSVLRRARHPLLSNLHHPNSIQKRRLLFARNRLNMALVLPLP